MYGRVTAYKVTFFNLVWIPLRIGANINGVLELVAKYFDSSNRILSPVAYFTYIKGILPIPFSKECVSQPLLSDAKWEL